MLKAWFEFLRSCPKEVDLSVDLVIYLRTTPEVAYQRLKARARSEEKIVSLEYLQDLHNLHEKWLQQGAEVLGSSSFKILISDWALKPKQNFDHHLFFHFRQSPKSLSEQNP